MAQESLYGMGGYLRTGCGIYGWFPCGTDFFVLGQSGLSIGDVLPYGCTEISHARRRGAHGGPHLVGDLSFVEATFA